MASPSMVGGRGGKVFQGSQLPPGASKSSQIKQGQTANLRPAGTLPVSQSTASSPTRGPMDYRTVVSPGKVNSENLNVGNSPRGLQYGVGQFGNQHFSNAANYYHAMEDLNYNRDKVFDDAMIGLQQGQTQDMLDNPQGWRSLYPQLHDQGLMETEDNVNPEAHAGVPPAPKSPDHGTNAAPVDDDESQDMAHPTQQLPGIPEATDSEGEEENQAETGLDSGYIDRHKAWIDVLDENLAINRRNPACREVSSDFEMDMSELMSAVDDIIETSEHEGQVATDTLVLDTKIFAEGLRQLQKHSLVIHTVDLRVTMAYFERPTLRVENGGVKGDGHAVWATFRTIKGLVGVICVYAPQTIRKREELWRWVTEVMKEGQWILTGDLNMVESSDDSNCKSTILSGDESFAWSDLKQETDVVDCYKEAARRVGPRILELGDGEITEDRERILHEIGVFYGSLFTEEGESTEVIEERQITLTMIDKKVSATDNRKLELVPTADDVQECKLNLANERLVSTGWKAGKGELQLAMENQHLRADLRMDVVLTAGEKMAQKEKAGWKVIKRRLKTMRVSSLGDLQGRPLERLKSADTLGYLPDTGDNSSGPLSKQMSIILEWANSASPSGQDFGDPTFWRWRTDKKEVNTSWQRSLQEWRKALTPNYNLREKLNSSWGVSWDTKKWMDIWRSLWSANLFPRDKLWTWRILNKGFFTMERGAAMEVSEPLCKRCEAGTENVEHIFLTCSLTANTWNTLSRWYNQATGKAIQNDSIPRMLEQATKQENTTIAALFAVHSRHTWRHRCKAVYEGSSSHTPAKIVLEEAEKMVVALAKRFPSILRQEALRKCRSEIINMKVVQINERIRREGRILPAQWSPHSLMSSEPTVEGATPQARNTDRQAATEGRHPKDRTEAPPTSSEQRSNPGRSREGFIWRSMRHELELLGFEEISLDEGAA
ncbi:hypothetical protein R1sor_003264 [Riccia sorocarpa]|uniref:Reverse transcriptase zinc-binding domain-containing protein n=1 Tax=Riccia sorocarpa TaxID=122646 RepID=A0ABD3H3T7_9MARC